MEIALKPSTFTNSSHTTFRDVTSFSYVPRTSIVQGFKATNNLCEKCKGSSFGLSGYQKPCPTIFQLSKSTENGKNIVTITSNTNGLVREINVILWYWIPFSSYLVFFSFLTTNAWGIGRLQCLFHLAENLMTISVPSTKRCLSSWSLLYRS